MMVLTVNEHEIRSQSIESIKEARNILSDDTKWTRGAIARDSEGASVEYDEEGAVSFCLLGSIRIGSERYGQVSDLVYDSAVDTMAEGLDYIAEGAYDYTQPDILYAESILQEWNDDICESHAQLVHFLDYIIQNVGG